MRLTESEKQGVETLVKSAFPRFTRWKRDVGKDDFTDFDVAGEYKWGRGIEALYFYVTIHTWQENWTAYLTLGQPAFFWTDTNEGDAYLFSVKGRSARDAISRLKRSMKTLFGHLTAELPAVPA